MDARNNLNEKQEKFCQAIMQGKTQRQAYYSAYPNSEKWKPESVDIQASKLANSPKVLLRLAELRAFAEEQNEISRNDLLEQLKSIGFADVDFYKIKPNDKIKAIEVMARILGYDKVPESDGKNRQQPDPLSASLKKLADGLDDGSVL